MKFRYPILAVLVLGASAAIADPPSGPPPGTHGTHGPSIERLTKDLSLNESQQAEVKRIFQEQRAKMDAQRQQFEASGTRPSREEMRAHHDEADADLHQQLAAVLSAEQLAKFDEMHKRQRPHGPPPGEDGGAPPQ